MATDIRAGTSAHRIHQQNFMSEATPQYILQAGVIPYRKSGPAIEVLLVTSRSRKRWIIPKGNIESHLDARESARLEAYEEAGVIGRITSTPIGTYRHDSKKPTRVEVYLMEVEEVLPEERWPEHDKRSREWMPLADAEARVLEDGLKVLLSRAAATVN